jgi:hypothetical protein
VKSLDDILDRYATKGEDIMKEDELEKALVKASESIPQKFVCADDGYNVSFFPERGVAEYQFFGRDEIITTRVTADRS